MASFLSDEDSSSKEDLERRESQPQPRRLKRVSLRGNRNSRSSLTQTQRRQSFLSDDESDTGQTQKLIQEIARNTSQVSGKAAKSSFLSSSDESDADSIGQVETTVDVHPKGFSQSAAWLGDGVGRDDTALVSGSRQKQDDSTKQVDSGSIPMVLVRSGDRDSMTDDHISIGNISDIHTSVPSGPDLEGSEETSPLDSSARRDTDSGEQIVDHNADDQAIIRVKSTDSASRVRSVAAVETTNIQQHNIAATLKASYPEVVNESASDTSVAASLPKPDNKELESLQQQFEEFATEQVHLSDSLNKVLDSERKNQAEELHKYMDVVADLKKVLEEERTSRSSEAKRHEELLQARFREHEERWESEMATLQAEIQQLRFEATAPIPRASPHNAAKAIMEMEVPLPSILPVASKTPVLSEMLWPTSPQSGEKSASVDTILGGSPSLFTIPGDEVNPLLLSSGIDAATFGTPASYVLHRKESPTLSRPLSRHESPTLSRPPSRHESPTLSRPLPGTVRLRSASPLLVNNGKENSGANLNIWFRSLADELREDELSHASKGCNLGKTISVSDEIERATANIIPDYLLNGREARVVQVPYVRHQQTIFPPPVRVPPAVGIPPLRVDEGARTPERLVPRFDMPIRCQYPPIGYPCTSPGLGL